MKTATKAQANQVLKALKKKYASLFGDEPGQLSPIDEPFLTRTSTGHWAVVWEAGSYEWAMKESWALQEKCPKVFLEPHNSYTLGVYPAE